MRVIKTSNADVNLCSFCPKTFSECNPHTIEFGNGVGNDNVIACSEYIGGYSKKYDIYPSNQIVPIQEITTNTASSNKTVSDYLKKITDEDPTVKLRKINKLAGSLIDDMDIAFEDDTLDDIDTIFTYDTLLEIVRLSEEKK